MTLRVIAAALISITGMLAGCALIYLAGSGQLPELLQNTTGPWRIALILLPGLAVAGFAIVGGVALSYPPQWRSPKEQLAPRSNEATKVGKGNVVISVLFVIGAVAAALYIAFGPDR